ncbi:terminase large subunit [Vibrio phage VP41s3]|nr:terminase large subunit [Vibrio phage VP41s3]
MSKIDEIREAAEADFWTFVRLITPQYVYGEVHKEVAKWLEDNTLDQLLLLPRGHLKSHLMAVWVAWWVTKHPETSILYISATSELAEMQLYDIKNMLTSKIYRRYWPEMINEEEGKREKWTNSAIAVDHPKRKMEGIRDFTIKTAGLTTNTTGWHADVIVSDDVVVPDNAYTEDGRKKVAAAMSQMESILNADGFVKACGTRYHPADIYDTWKRQMQPVFDEHGEETGDETPVWDIFERVVEEDGVFIWPRTARGSDGKKFGFDKRVLAKKKAKYVDRVQFFAQYYNDPNDPESARLSYDGFQYYDPKYITYHDGRYWFKEKPLNVYAAVDFAFSLSKTADYTAIVVVGIDSEGYIYVLDIDRFKTDKIQTYYDHITALHSKWEFKKLRAEVTVAQKIIVNDIKDKLRAEGMTISIEDFRPNKSMGSKEERIAAVLEPRYEQQVIWHRKGGYTPMLEEELVLARPPHDDLKDALASAVEIAVKPIQRGHRRRNNVIQFNSRFGGIN